MSNQVTESDIHGDIFFSNARNKRGIKGKFCGTHKTRDMIRDGITYSNTDDGVALFVFPSLSLIFQFHSDYLSPDAIKKSTNDFSKQIPLYKILSICSSEELRKCKKCLHNVSTSPDDIRKFLLRGGKRIITITYTSLPKFVDVLISLDKQYTIDIALFDEAHHITSKKISDIIENFEFNERLQKSLFYTATPDERMNMPIIYKYTHKQAVKDGVCSDFTLLVRVMDRSDNIDIYRRIYIQLAHSILSTERTRVLTFHYQVDGNKTPQGKTAVDVFHNYTEFERIFNEVKKLYPASELELDRFEKITSSTKRRRRILDDFEKTTPNKVFIISSCNTIGEGIDTRSANMIFFADAKGTPKDILQNIGRGTRIREVPQDCMVVSLCTIDIEMLIGCARGIFSNKKDIIDAVTGCGNFKPILDILNALKHYDPEYYGRCIDNFKNSTAPTKRRKLDEPSDSNETIKMIVQYDDDIRSSWNLCNESLIYNLSKIIEKGIMTEFANVSREEKITISAPYIPPPRRTSAQYKTSKPSKLSSGWNMMCKVFNYLSTPSSEEFLSHPKRARSENFSSLLEF